MLAGPSWTVFSLIVAPVMEGTKIVHDVTTPDGVV